MRILIVLAATLSGACALPDEYDYDVDMDATFRKESTTDCGRDPDRPLACVSLGERVPCTSLGFLGGTFAECGFTRHGCSYGTELCEGVVCGDGVTEGSEECDYSVPDELFVACGQDRPAPVSRLACASDCTLTEESCGWCGDGVVTRRDHSINTDPYSEECDPADTSRLPTCDDFYGYRGSETVPCSADCEFDVSACLPSRCGDGYFDTRSEVCEQGTDTAVVPCESLPGYRGGGLAVCQSNCFYDVSDCTRTACGDGVVESPLEACEPRADRSQWCDGFPVPEFAVCTENCSLDGAVCGERWCGDGTVQGAEECDPAADRASWVCTNGIVGDVTACVDCRTIGCVAFDAGANPDTDSGAAADAESAPDSSRGEPSRGCASAKPSPPSASALLAAFALLGLRRRGRAPAVPTSTAR